MVQVQYNIDISMCWGQKRMADPDDRTGADTGIPIWLRGQMAPQAGHLCEHLLI